MRKSHWCFVVQGMSALLLSCMAAKAADATYDGMYFVSQDVNDVDYLVESTTIAEPGPGLKTATVYRVEDDGIGNIQSWELRCSHLGIKLLADHDYEQFDDGTWGDGDGPPADSDFKAVTKKTSMGQVAQFACRWPTTSKDQTPMLALPSDPKARIQLLVRAAEKPNK